MLAALRRRDFALVCCAGLISLTGDRALTTALPFYVYQQTGSTLATAALFIAFYLPMVLLGSVAGVFADRWDRRRIMAGANLIQTVVIAALLLVRPGARLWLIYPVTFVTIAVAMFFQPAERALLPRLVREDQLVPANALMGLTDTLARLAGPPLGGALLGFFGLSSVALVDSASFLIAAALVARLPACAPPSAGRIEAARPAASAWARVSGLVKRRRRAHWERGRLARLRRTGRASSTASAPRSQNNSRALARIWREWRDGLMIVKRERGIAALAVVFTMTSLGGTIIDPLYAPFVRSVLHGGPAALGWLSTTGAMGGLLAGVIVGRFGRDIRPRRLTVVGTVGAGVLMLATYNQTALPAAMLLGFLMSVPVVAAGIGSSTMLQLETPDAYRGRIYSALNTTNALTSMASVGLVGAFGNVLGIVPMLNMAGVITISAGALALVLLPKVEARRELDAAV